MCSKEVVEASQAEVHIDPNREVSLGDCPFQVPLQEPRTPFNMSDFTLEVKVSEAPSDSVEEETRALALDTC